jgi:hypothetical protein
MEVRQRRSFTNDYKRQAVDLVASSGRSIGSVAKRGMAPPVVMVTLPSLAIYDQIAATVGEAA